MRLLVTLLFVILFASACTDDSLTGGTTPDMSEFAIDYSELNAHLQAVADDFVKPVASRLLDTNQDELESLRSIVAASQEITMGTESAANKERQLEKLSVDAKRILERVISVDEYQLLEHEAEHIGKKFPVLSEIDPFVVEASLSDIDLGIKGVGASKCDGAGVASGVLGIVAAEAGFVYAALVGCAGATVSFP